jgi:hypothetical protein
VDAHDVEVIDAMRRYGGGFIRALAEAAARADDEKPRAAEGRLARILGALQRDGEAVRFYHGGVPGLKVGDSIVPSPPHVEDGCPICVARSEGRRFTVAQARAWALSMGRDGLPLLRALAGAPANGAVDPPSAQTAVYITKDLDYGDLVRRAKPWRPLPGRGQWERRSNRGRTTSRPGTVPEARVLAVLRRGVFLLRADRRRIERRWRKADRSVA